MQWDAIERELNGPNQRLVWLGWDGALAASVVWLQVRVLATVVRINRTLTITADTVVFAPTVVEVVDGAS